MGYSHLNEANDYALVELSKHEKLEPTNVCNSNSRTAIKGILCQSNGSSNGDGNSRMNDLAHYTFLNDKFPTNKCLECGDALLAIPLCHIGDGYVNDECMGVYKICALCPNYPDCVFPLARANYGKYWIQSAYFDGITSSNNRKRLRMDDVDCNNKVKRRKMNKEKQINSYDYLQALSNIIVLSSDDNHNHNAYDEETGNDNGNEDEEAGNVDVAS